MRKGLLTTFAATLSLFMSQCSELPTQKETADGSKSIRIEIKTAPGFDTIAAHAYVQISADDMKSTIQQKLTISNDWISGVVRNVPAGYNRHFEVFVHGFDSTLLYYGDTVAAIYSGKETYVTIILRKPGGTAIINGYIEEYYPPQDTIPTPGMPYFYSFDTTSTIPPRLSQLTLATIGSKYPDSLFYIWRIFQIVDNDTFYNKYLLGQTYTLNYPKDGIYQVSVAAMSMYDSSKISGFSFTKIFKISNGLLADSLTPIDVTPPSIKLNGSDSVKIKLYSSYIEQGAKAYDNVDGDLTSLIKINGHVDTSKAGIYYIKYYVTDKAGNFAGTMRIVFVSSSSDYDTISPVITLKGPGLIEIAPNDTFIEPGFIALDDVDGDITSRVKFWFTIDSSNANTTKITYSVCDNAGNCTQTTRFIVKKAKVLPTPSTPVIMSSKFNGKTMSITFQTSDIKPVSSGTVYYDWTISTPDTPGFTNVTTTKNSLTFNFENNTFNSVMVMARCLAELSYMSHVLQFSVENGKVVYPGVMKILD